MSYITNESLIKALACIDPETEYLTASAYHGGIWWLQVEQL